MKAKTLKDLLIEKLIRKGAAHGTTKRGAYWTPVKGEYFEKIRRSGGDGIGNSAPDVSFYLELRHFRDGTVKAVIVRVAWHQNGSYSGAGTTYADASSVLDCTTAEEVVVALKAISMDEESVISERGSEWITAACIAFGLPESAPAPDEEDTRSAAAAAATAAALAACSGPNHMLSHPSFRPTPTPTPTQT